jgi:hypothetical protein
VGGDWSKDSNIDYSNYNYDYMVDSLPRISLPEALFFATGANYHWIHDDVFGKVHDVLSALFFPTETNYHWIHDDVFGKVHDVLSALFFATETNYHWIHDDVFGKVHDVLSVGGREEHHLALGRQRLVDATGARTPTSTTATTTAWSTAFRAFPCLRAAVGNWSKDSNFRLQRLRPRLHGRQPSARFPV